MKYEISIEHWKYGKRILVFEDEYVYLREKKYYVNLGWKINNEAVVHDCTTRRDSK